MLVTIDGSDLEVAPGTPLRDVLSAVGLPTHRWCGATRLDLTHRAGSHPLVHGALLAAGPQASSVTPRGPHLAVIAGPDAGAVVELHGPLVVGRDGDLTLADPELSGRHCEVRPDGRARDLGSSNGTVVRREGARPRRLPRRSRASRALHHGDLLEAGASVLQWRDPGAASRAAPAASPGAPPGRATLGAGALGAGMGGLGIGIVTGRWALGIALALIPLAAAGATVLLHRWRDSRKVPWDPPGLLALSEAALPVAIVGTPESARGAARALALATGAGLGAPLAEPWMAMLPRTHAAGDVRVVAPGQGPPTDVSTVLDADAGTMCGAGPPRPWAPAVVTAATAALTVRQHTEASPQLPDTVRWAELAQAPDRNGLHATLGAAQDGVMTVDLDADGPHLLVAGTTGAGKSLLLETLVSALAWAHPPSRLAIALVDFKGGAGLRPCMALPHVCATLTDLDPHLARRALTGFGAEVELRKRLLKDAGHHSWQGWERAGTPPPRLLVVVDEFQELASRDRGFVPEITRLAAQGRALGIHLVLATQRPAGAVTADIRANVGSIIALRVTSSSESQDLVGDGTAAALPAHLPGRAVLARAGRTVTFQTALPLAQPRPAVHLVAAPPPPGESLADAAAHRWAGTETPAPLWLPPLPSALEPAPGVALVCDAPASRERVMVRWEPDAGPCVILGPARSGRTTAMRALVHAHPDLAGAVWLPPDPREAARTLELARRTPGTVLLVDDAPRAVDALSRAESVPGELQLEEACRMIPMAIAAAPGWSPRWASRAALRVLLTGLDPTERTLWGVPAHLGDPDPAPGRAVVGTALGWMHAQVVDAPLPPDGPRLVQPLALPASLPPAAVGVGGDSARPLAAPASAVVVGPAGPERARIARLLTSRGAAVEQGEDPHGGGQRDWTVVVHPTRERLRRWGVTVEPGLVDPDPPPGRVLILARGEALAAQLRR